MGFFDRRGVLLGVLGLQAHHGGRELWRRNPPLCSSSNRQIIVREPMNGSTHRLLCRGADLLEESKCQPVLNNTAGLRSLVRSIFRALNCPPGTECCLFERALFALLRFCHIISHGFLMMGRFVGLKGRNSHSGMKKGRSCLHSCNFQFANTQEDSDLFWRGKGTSSAALIRRSGLPRHVDRRSESEEFLFHAEETTQGPGAGIQVVRPVDGEAIAL
jgi:hypothetical protein